MTEDEKLFLIDKILHESDSWSGLSLIPMSIFPVCFGQEIQENVLSLPNLIRYKPFPASQLLKKFKISLRALWWTFIRNPQFYPVKCWAYFTRATMWRSAIISSVKNKDPIPHPSFPYDKSYPPVHFYIHSAISKFWDEIILLLGATFDLRCISLFTLTMCKIAKFFFKSYWISYAIPIYCTYKFKNTIYSIHIEHSVCLLFRRNNRIGKSVRKKFYLNLMAQTLRFY